MSRKRKTTEEFIKEARATHGDKYNYGKVKYINRHSIITITCPKHGDFPQIAGNHLDGHGCPHCAKEVKTKTAEEFITKANVIHGNKYTYDKVRYINNYTILTITCPIHGDFPQIASDHLRGHGCPACARERNIEATTNTTEEFIAEAKKIHGGKYSYDKVEYKGNDEKVIITCPIHGDFPRTPHNHKAGCGCPKCNQSHLEREVSLNLKKHNIKYKPEKTFTWLKNKREMPLDFYLPEFNVAIECQGIQHYKTTGGVFTKEKVECTQKNDKLKFQLCQEHGICIHYIKYNENVSENIEKLIKELNNIIH